MNLWGHKDEDKPADQSQAPTNDQPAIPPATGGDGGAWPTGGDNGATPTPPTPADGGEGSAPSAPAGGSQDWTPPAPQGGDQPGGETPTTPPPAGDDKKDPM